MSSQDHNRIERLKKGLYSRKNPYEFTDERTPIETSQTPEVVPEWVTEEAAPPAPEPKRNTMFKKLFLISGAFFVVCIAVAAYIFLGGLNLISTRNVDIEVQVPVSIAGGQELPIEVTVVNRNNASITSVELVIEYPDGTRSVMNAFEPLVRDRVTIDEIRSGTSAIRLFKAVLYGEENTIRDIKVGVVYQVAGSQSTFSKEKNQQIRLTSSPVSMAINALKEVSSNQDFNIEITLTSNSNRPIENVLLRADYPFGFILKDASPQPAFGSNVWNIGTMAPQEKKVLRLQGLIEGQDGEDRTIRFILGIADPLNEKVIGTEFFSTLQTVSLKKPFIGVTLQMGTPREDWYAANRGASIPVLIDWKSNVPYRIVNAEIRVKMSGVALDRQSVNVQNGFYRSSDSTIVWDGGYVDGLRVVDPSASGG